MTFPFLELPDSVRQHIYSYLGFPTEDKVVLFTDKYEKQATATHLRGRYNVDFSRSEQLSQPWGYGQKDRAKQQIPRVYLPLMLVNRFICDELYTLLYSNSVFMVNLHPARPSSTLTLTSHANKYITHLIISYHTRPDLNTTLLPNTTTHHESIVAAITRITALTPNLIYFGLNFWTPSLPTVFPNFHFNATTTLLITPNTNTPTNSPSSRSASRNKPSLPITKYEAASLKAPVTFDHAFLLPTINRLVQGGKIKTFALLREGRGRGVLDWDRDRKNVMKGVSRDLRNGIAKVVV